MVSPLEQFDVIRSIDLHFFCYDISITSAVLPLLFLNAFFIWFIFVVNTKFSLIPGP